MLTDRQFVALQLFANVTSKWSEMIFVSKIKDEETVKRIADCALFYADIFLKQSGGNIDIGDIEQEFKTIGDKLEIMNGLNQKLAQTNKKLLDLVTGDIKEEVEIECGTIAWIDGEPVYSGEGE